MTDEELMIEAELRRNVSESFGPVAEEVEWVCDVKEATFDTIASCNEYLRSQGRIEEDKFRNVTGKHSSISDLLRQDYEYLAASPKFTILRSLASQIRFYETERAVPNAGIVTLHLPDKLAFAIVFNSQMISLLNATFSKIYIITHDFRHAGCIPKFDDQMQEPAYMDTQLLLGIFRDLEDLFVNEEPYVLVNPPHLASPYDYCERVDGARRFIVGHEIAHIFYEGSKSAIEVDMERFKTLDPRIKEAWERELWCDALGLNFLMGRSEDPKLTGVALYEMENALVGILTYFTFMEVVECSLSFLNLIPTTHPPAKVRREFLRNRMKHHKTFIENPSIQDVLSTHWKRLHSFREFAGGALGPAAFPGTWNRTNFHENLSPFGQQAIRVRLRPGCLILRGISGFACPVRRAYGRDRMRLTRPSCGL